MRSSQESYVWGVKSLCCWKNVEKKIQRSRARQSWTKKWRFSLNKVSLLVWWSFRLSRHCSEYLKGFSSSLCYSNMQFWVKSIGLRMTTIQVRVHTSSHHKFSKINFPHHSLMQWVDIVAFTIYVTTVSSKKKRRELSDMSGAMKKKPSRISHAMCLWINQIFFPAKLFWVDSVAGWLWAQSDSHSTRRAVCVQVKIDIYLEEYESESYMRL